MSLQFYIGASGSGKSTLLYDTIIMESQHNPHTNYLIIVPDQFTMQTQKDVVMQHPCKGIMNIDVLSFSRLAYRIFDETGGNDRPVLDDTGKSLILRKIAANQESQLKVIGKNIKKIGYIHEIKSAISEFMQYDIGDKELSEMIAYSQKRGALQYKLQDLQILYRGFTEYIKEKFITTEETLDLVRRSLVHSEIIRSSKVIFDGFTGFTPLQNRLIQELMVRAKEVVVTVTMDTRENPYLLSGEQSLFYLSQKTIASLVKLSEEAGVSRKEDIILQDSRVIRYKDNQPLAHLERELFRYPFHPFLKDQQSIHLFEATSPKEELRQVCIKIRDIIREKGYAYRDIAVVCGNLGSYASQAEEIFSTYEIPCYLDQTQEILLNPFIEYIRSGLQIGINHFSYESVFHFLRSGFTGYEVEVLDELENYILALGIRGESAWKQPFMKRSLTMKDPVAELYKLNLLRQDFYRKIQPLVIHQGSMDQLVRLLYEFILDSKIQEKLMAYERKMQEKKNYIKAKEFSQIYPLVMELLDQMSALLGEEILTLKEFSDILDAGFGEIEVGTIPQSVDRVVLGDIERTRLKKIKILFFMGLNDGVIPKSGQKGGIISDIDREYLCTDLWEMAPSPRMQMYIQKLYLYLNMTKPSEELYLSFAKVDQEGKSLRPAYLVETLCKLFPKLEIERPQLMEMEKRIETYGDGLYHLVMEIRKYATGMMTEEDEENRMLSLIDQYKDNIDYKNILEEITQAAFFQYTDYSLSKKLASMLYGEVLYNSVSRLETFAGCAYAHYLQYGMLLKEREIYSFEVQDMGTVFHQVLEEFSRELEKNEHTWFDFSKTEGERLIGEIMERVAIGYGDTVLYSSSRNEYVITQMKRILCRTVDTLQYQLKKGTFIPSLYEVSFREWENMESISILLKGDAKMVLRGRIDRIDTYEEENNLYIKIMDYKSGKKEFDLMALYYGLQLQLMVYMNVAMHIHKIKQPDKKIIPGAVFYYQLKDPLVDIKGEEFSSEEIQREIRAQLKMTGMVNDDSQIIHSMDQSIQGGSDVIPVKYNSNGSLSGFSKVLSEEAFMNISKYVNKKVKEIGDSILEGQLSINPIEDKKLSSCSYCKYSSICGFDQKIPGYKKRKMEDGNMEEAYCKIMEALLNINDQE